jgi:hypothetical protein
MFQVDKIEWLLVHVFQERDMFQADARGQSWGTDDRRDTILLVNYQGLT